MPIITPLPVIDDARAEPCAVTVRHAMPVDLDALVMLEQRSFSGDRLSRAQYRRHLRSASARVLIAAAHGHPCLGSAVLFFRTGSTLARLYSLATQPEARGQGVGTVLLEAASEAARAHHCRALRLEVRTDNSAAITLYERLGYRRIGGYPHYYQDGADAWRYELAVG